jgi:hypothetical protein
MSWAPDESLPISYSSIANQYTSDRYINHGEELIRESALTTIEKLKSLPPRQAKGFATSFKRGTDKLAVAQDKLIESHQLMPAELPSPLKKVALR